MAAINIVVVYGDKQSVENFTKDIKENHRNVVESPLDYIETFGHEAIRLFDIMDFGEPLDMKPFAERHLKVIIEHSQFTEDNLMVKRIWVDGSVDMELTRKSDDNVGSMVSQMSNVGGIKYKPDKLKQLRHTYPSGTRIRLIEMNDPYHPVPSGTLGTVDHVDDGCNIHMKWDNGSGLALVPEVDRFEIVEEG